MKTLQVGEFKSRLSEIINELKDGEEITLSFGKKKEKIAVLIPYSKYIKKNNRKLGILQNKAGFTIKNKFKFSDDEFFNS